MDESTHSIDINLSDCAGILGLKPVIMWAQLLPRAWVFSCGTTCTAAPLTLAISIAGMLGRESVDAFHVGSKSSYRGG